MMLNLINANTKPNEVGYWGPVVFEGCADNFIYADPKDNLNTYFAYITTKEIEADSNQ